MIENSSVRRISMIQIGSIFVWRMCELEDKRIPLSGGYVRIKIENPSVWITDEI